MQTVYSLLVCILSNPFKSNSSQQLISECMKIRPLHFPGFKVRWQMLNIRPTFIKNNIHNAQIQTLKGQMGFSEWWIGRLVGLSAIMFVASTDLMDCNKTRYTSEKPRMITLATDQEYCEFVPTSFHQTTRCLQRCQNVSTVRGQSSEADLGIWSNFKTNPFCHLPLQPNARLTKTRYSVKSKLCTVVNINQ